MEVFIYLISQYLKIYQKERFPLKMIFLIILFQIIYIFGLIKNNFFYDIGTKKIFENQKKYYLIISESLEFSLTEIIQLMKTKDIRLDLKILNL